MLGLASKTKAVMAATRGHRRGVCPTWSRFAGRRWDSENPRRMELCLRCLTCLTLFGINRRYRNGGESTARD